MTIVPGVTGSPIAAKDVDQPLLPMLCCTDGVMLVPYCLCIAASLRVANESADGDASDAADSDTDGDCCWPALTAKYQ